VTQLSSDDNPHICWQSTYIRTGRTSCLGSATGASQARNEPDVPRGESGYSGVALAAWTLAAFAVGLFGVILVRRVVPAMFATIATWAGLAFATGALLRALPVAGGHQQGGVDTGPEKRERGHIDHRASVGDMRAARSAGSSPATAPTSNAAAKPAPHATGGITIVHPRVTAYTAVAVAPAATPTTPPSRANRTASARNWIRMCPRVAPRCRVRK
jgi:hypothetical protein